MQNLPTTFVIPQDGYINFNISINVKNAIILSNLKYWFDNEKSKSIIRGGKKYIWVNYMNIINSFPILGIKNKNTLTVRFNQLQKAGLIEKYQEKDNTLYIRITELTQEIYNYSSDNPVHSKRDRVSTETKMGYPAKYKQSSPLKTTQHNNKYIKSFNKYLEEGREPVVLDKIKEDLRNNGAYIDSKDTRQMDKEILKKYFGLGVKTINKAEIGVEHNPNQKRKIEEELLNIKIKNDEKYPGIYEQK